ncbi:DUF4190 domain-containing protein [Microbacterium sp. NPDC058345]|uniref:DUF4190 domain-containing protein n=1 Tax=Microbacterium sp. NPDC058345 TaxID=3346455 RepID=UPI003658011A
MSDQPEPQHDQNPSTYPPPVPPAPASAGYPGAAVTPAGYSVPPYAPPPAPEPYRGQQHPSAPQSYPQPYQPGRLHQRGQPYQPPQPYAVHPAQPYAQPRPTSGLAVASLVCGLAGLVLSWLVFPILASVAAVITGHMALKQTGQRPDLAGRGLAIAGLILGYVGVGFLVLAMAGGLLALLTTGVALLPFFFV